MLYKEWIYTLRNWRRVAFGLGFALFYIVTTTSRSGLEGVGLYIPLALALSFTTLTSPRLDDDIARQLGAVYLRTKVSPFAQMVTKWAFDSAVGFAAVSAAVVVMTSRGRFFGPLDVVQLLLSAGALTATNMLLMVFLPQVRHLARFGLIFLAFFVAGGNALSPVLRAVGYFVLPLGALLGVRDVAFGQVSWFVSLVTLGETFAFLGIIGARYRHVLMDRL